MLGTDKHTFAPTKEYLDICVLFGVFMTLQTIMSSFLRAEGKVKHSVIGMIIGIAANIILDPLFILKFHMGAGGAAWATILGNAMSVIYFLIVFLNEKPLYRYASVILDLQKRYILKLLKLVFLLLLDKFLWVLPMLCSII